ncbi:hypothetical protein L6164_027875 [Bauhinia variegata]|uniref:Uncharacterized protein n=1 Tax=Bauhinia variegata TaxID=167791 RepID=A0ACB9LU99_BAUVA|nr:hypothetical protein L6164_027875 [Bauhinia variegata]
MPFALHFIVVHDITELSYIGLNNPILPILCHALPFLCISFLIYTIYWEHGLGTESIVLRLSLLLWLFLDLCVSLFLEFRQILYTPRPWNLFLISSFPAELPPPPPFSLASGGSSLHFVNLSLLLKESAGSRWSYLSVMDRQRLSLLVLSPACFRIKTLYILPLQPSCDNCITFLTGGWKETPQTASFKSYNMSFFYAHIFGVDSCLYLLSYTATAFYGCKGGYRWNVENAALMSFSVLGLSTTATGCMHALKQCGKQPYLSRHK